MDDITNVRHICRTCEYEADADFKYCPNCGNQKVIVIKDHNPFNDKNLISLLAYFFISLLVLLAYKFSKEHLIGLFEDLVIVCAVLAVVDLAFAFYNGRESFLFSVRKLEIKSLLLLLTGLLVFAFVVSLLADFLNQNLSDGYYFDIFGLTYPLATVILFQCAYPAFFEELAFRGFLINNIRSLSNDRTAIGVSAFLFGIIHLSFVGLIWQIPLGLLFGYMRIRYNTLWYGIIGHFFYNLLVTLIDRGVI